MSFLKQIGINLELENEPINRLKEQAFKSLETLENFFLNLDHPLKKTALNTVFSNHNYHSTIMIIGEAPGAEEDRQGEPFVGKSGQLLTLMLKAIGLDRKNVYITNLIPWRPPGNRTPSKEEMEFFLPFIKQHIMLKNPLCIILLGGIITRALLGNEINISQIRGGWRQITIGHKNFPLLCSFHPSYLLRSPKQKKLAWLDFLSLKHFLEKNEI